MVVLGRDLRKLSLHAFCTVQFVSEQYFRFLVGYDSICEQHSSFSEWYICLFCEQNGLFLAWYGSFLKGNSTVRFEVMVVRFKFCNCINFVYNETTYS